MLSLHSSSELVVGELLVVRISPEVLGSRLQERGSYRLHD